MKNDDLGKLQKLSTDKLQALRSAAVESSKTPPNPELAKELERDLSLAPDPPETIIAAIDAELKRRGNPTSKTGQASQNGKQTPPSLAMKCYRAENCNRHIQAKNGMVFEFQPVGYLGGSWRGVYATDDPKRQAALAQVMQSDKSITEITAEDYQKLSKKKVPASQNYNPLHTQPLKPEPQALVGAGAVVVENPSGSEAPPAATQGKPLESLDAALQVGEVKEDGKAPEPKA